MQRINSHLKTFISQDQNFLQLCTIRSINELDDKIRNISDIYTFQSLIQQLNNNLPRVIYNRQKFIQIVKRLLEAVCFAAEKYGYDVIRTTYLIDKISYIARYWKKVLVRQSEILPIVKKQSKFVYILDKNQFVYFLMKASNRLIEKDVIRSLKSKMLNLQSLYYLRQSNLNVFLQRVHVKMIQTVKQTQNQTYLKIQLLIQFMKYILFQLNYCMKTSDFERIFEKFFQLTLHTLRLIRKFYSVQIIQMVNIFKNLLVKALQIYKKIYSQDPLKYKRLTMIINIIDRNKSKMIQRKSDLINKSQLKKTQDNFFCPNSNNNGNNNNMKVEFKNCQNFQNPNKYVIKLALRLLKNWKSINSKKNKQTHTKQKSISDFYQNLPPHFFNKMLNLQQSQRQHLKKQNFQKQIHHLKNRSKRMHSLQKNQDPNMNNIRIRKQIQQQLYRQFGKLKYLRNYQQNEKKSKLYNSNKKKTTFFNQKRSKSLFSVNNSHSKNHFNINNNNGINKNMNIIINNKENYQERQVTIQEYREKLMMCRPTVETVNQIKFYKPEKHDQIIKSRINQDKTNQSKQSFFNHSKYLKLNMIFSESKKIKVKRNGQVRERLKL